MSPSRPAISLSRSATKGSYKVKGWIDLFKRSLKTLKTHRMLLSPSFSSLGVKPSTMYITKASTVLYRTWVSQDKLLEKSPAGFTQVLSPDKIWFVFNSLFSNALLRVAVSFGFKLSLDALSFKWYHAKNINYNFNGLHPRQFLEQRQAATTLDWATNGALAPANISYVFQHCGEFPS